MAGQDDWWINGIESHLVDKVLPAVKADAEYIAKSDVVAEIQADAGYISKADAAPDWATYTLAITGVTVDPVAGSSPESIAAYRVVGKSLEIMFGFRQVGAGSSGTGAYRFSIPDGLTMDTTKILTLNGNGGTVLGAAHLHHLASQREPGIVFAVSDSLLTIISHTGSNTMTEVSSTFFGLSVANASYGFNIVVPIE